ncbi:MAG TPA: hypothetical protein VHZ78_14845 [Rhizomicrobium sp.]|nr:hypothetical protein [Rhizomicrobium sp.]
MSRLLHSTTFLICLVLAVCWLLASGFYLYLQGDFLLNTPIMIACGYPDAHGPAYDACIAGYRARSAGFWPAFVLRNCLWAIVPMLGLLGIGTATALLCRPAAG